jgi:outer membrane protein
MRIDKTLVVLGAAGVIAMGLGATDDAVKIGLVDVEQAIISTDEGKAGREELERKVREAEGKLEPMVGRFQEMLKDAEAKQFVLSEEAMRQKRLDLAELQNQIQNRKREIEGQLQVDRERLLGPMRGKLTTVINDIGRKQGFSLILQRNTPGVMYAREALDITDMVIAAFNEED